MPSLNDSIISRKQLRGLFGKRSETVQPPADAAEAAPAGSPSSAAPGYWRSLDELAQTPEFEAMLQREFSSVAADVIEPTSRRGFLKFMGASLALAGIGLTSCRWPEEKITPFARKQDGYMMGVPVQFATAIDIGGFATGLLATSYDGRPVKLEGNPLHPGSLGAASGFHQASLLDLYDANRAKTFVRRDAAGQDGVTITDPAAFTTSVGQVFASHRRMQGSRLAILCEAHSSPTRARLLRELTAVMPLAQWFEYEPLSWDSVREGTRQAFGQPLRPHYDLEAAEVVVSFNCDFLESHPDSLRLARDWAKRRRGTGGRMNRVYMIEPSLSITGAKADHRLPIRPSRIDMSIAQLASQLDAALGLGLPNAVLNGAAAEFTNGASGGRSWNALVKDLAANRGRSVIMAGPDCSPEAQAIAALLNHALGNVGETVHYTAEEQPLRISHDKALSAIASGIDSGGISTLLILGGNPVYDAPAELHFGEKLAKLENSIHLSLHPNETSQICNWLVPRAHFLEEWGDARGYDGSISIVQPLIEPLYGGLSPIQLLAMLVHGNPAKGYDLVRETFMQGKGSAGEEAWREALHAGIIKGSSWLATVPSGYLSAALKAVPTYPTGDYELHLQHDYSVYDGRFANNGWMQETPDPLTKVTWDNVALVSPADAKALGVKHEDLLEVSANGVKVELPVFVLPGQAKGVISASLGYGRQQAGDIGNGVGRNVYPLRGGEHLAWTTAALRPTGGTYNLACTQDHHAIDARGFEERAKRVGSIVREANLEFYNEHPDFPKHMTHGEPGKSRWLDWKYPAADNAATGETKTHRWGMSIDVSTCTGCSACVVACTAENNIPVVGKLRVRQGREMQWLRIDRYFRSPNDKWLETPDNPKVAMLPMTCQQCELAPCEQVCPVNATTHSDEGLNDMVYNRCIGTRYCSNNCPFKVRRFNYFNYQKSLTETQKLVHNPEVTIRSRGVMEKCTYCVQRIQNHKIAARNEKRDLKDGEIKTACQQTCPTDAIIFGDLNDPTSRVFELSQGYLSDRSYTQLDELELRPRTSYLAGLWNPAPDTDEAELPAPHLYEHHGAGHGDSHDHSHPAGNGHAHGADGAEHMMEEAAPAGH